MILFKLHSTSRRNITLARNLIIKGNKYFIDIYTRKYLETHPNKKQELYILEGHDYFQSAEFKSFPIIEIE